MLNQRKEYDVSLLDENGRDYPREERGSAGLGAPGNGIVNAAFPPFHGEVLTNIGARLDEIHWVVKYESPAQMEESRARVKSDEQYQAFLKEQREGGLFVSAFDRFYRVLGE